jgi:hypothetical protein
MKQTVYQQCKALLNDASIYAKKRFNSDYPAQREYLNDTNDYLIKEYRLDAYKANLLSNYTCTLHPKNK